jgi:hypothetical protein
MADPPSSAPMSLHDGGIALARLAGPRANLQLAVDEVAALLATARDAGVRRIVLDLTGLSGLPVPTVAERHAMVRAWATAAGGRIVVAMACPPELIDPERFGIVAAANFGLPANVFANVDDALAWLRTT